MTSKFHLRFPLKLIENILLRISIFGLLSLILIQFFLSNDSIKSIVGNDNNSNVIAIEESATYLSSGWIDIEIRSLSRYKGLKLLKNGEEVEELIRVGNVMQIEVLDGDVIELDATKYDEPVNVRIVGTSDNIKVPHIGQQFES